MRKRARSVLTGLLVLCCALAGLVPMACVQANSSGSTERDIVVTENSGLARTAYPVAVSLATESSTVSQWHLAGPAGNPISCSVQQTATDTLMLHFLADLPANSVQTFKLLNDAGSPVTGVTQLPLFMGTSYLVYVEKVLEVASYESDNLVRLIRADGTPLLQRTLAADEPMSYTTASPQVVRVDAMKPVSAWLMTMAPDSQQQALSSSNDDVYGTAGTDLLILTFGELWLAAPLSTSVSLTGQGSVQTVVLSPASVRFVGGLKPGVYRLRSSSPVCITSGVEEDNISCVQYPIGTWFAGPSFGQTTVTSWEAGTTVTTFFAGSTQAFPLPKIGSSATRTTVARNAFAQGRTEWQPIVVRSDGPYTLITDGNSGNFGLEQYPSTTLAASGLTFVVTSGKTFSGFSSGHFRRLAIVGVQDGADVTLSTGTSSQQFSLNTAQVKIVRINAGSIPIRLASTRPVELLDLGEDAREGIAVALPLADSSVTASVTKVSSSIPAASAGTVETTQTPAPAKSPWQTAWTWIQRMTRSTGTWIQGSVRSIGAFFASWYVGIRDFFVSGQALKMLQTATQAINDLAVRLFLPLSGLVLPLLTRVVPGLSVTPELLAVWIFWKIVVLALIILILALRPWRHQGKALPRVTPRTAGQRDNTIEFGLVEQGPKPSATSTLDQLARTHEKQELPPLHEPTVRPTVSEGSTHPRLESPSVPEISLEPLSFFGGTDIVPTVPAETASMPAPAAAPPLEFTPSEAQSPAAQAAVTESMTPSVEEAPAVPADIPSEALLTPPQESPSAEESRTETANESPAEPELRPMGEEAPVQPVESESSSSDTVIPLGAPLSAEETPATEAAAETEETPVSETPAIPLVASIEEPGSAEETIAPAHEEVPAVDETTAATQPAPEIAVTPEAVITEVGSEEPPTVQPPEPIVSAPSSADLLSRLLDEEQSFPEATAAAGAAASAPVPARSFVPAAPPANKPTPQPSVFSGDVQLDTLLRDGVVVDAGALSQLFRGGYRSHISKLAVSAKDLQNVPEEMRQLIKLTVVALSPIELSIARDLAMRLEAPGFVGEALLVAKKMGYENYLTTYKNISKNYKDVSIVPTASLTVPDVSTESSGDLISFS